MAKDTPFKTYDLERRRIHSLTTPPAKITRHRMSKDEWASEARTAAPAPTKVKKGRSNTKRKAKKPPRSAAAVVRCASKEATCLQCGRSLDDRECTVRCYSQFRKEQFLPNAIDIRGPGELGFGAYTKPHVTIKKGQWLEEYLGDLRPISSADTSSSLYRIWIPDTCIIDAEKAGNWTRFINSSCRPNVKPWGEFLGKRHVVMFQALRDIGPEEELTFQYGSAYFEQAGFLCRCGAHKEPHMPGEKKAKEVHCKGKKK